MFVRLFLVVILWAEFTNILFGEVQEKDVNFPFYQYEVERYIEEGKKLYEGKEYEKAKDRFGIAFIIAKAKNDKRFMGIAGFWLANCSLQIKNYDDAIRYIRISERYVKYLAKNFVIRIYFLLGKIYEEKKRYRLAISYYKRAIQEAKNISDKELPTLIYAEVLFRISNLYITIYQGNRKYLKKAYEYFVRAGNMYIDAKRYEKGILSLYKGMKIAYDIELPSEKYRDKLKNLLHYSIFMKLINRAYDIAYLLLSVYIREYRLIEAIRLLESLIEKDVFRKRQDFLANIFSELAHLYKLAKLHNKAIIYYNKAMELYSLQGMRKERIATILELFYLYLSLGNFHQAMITIEKLETFDNINSLNIMDKVYPALLTKAHVYNLKATLFLLMKEIKKARNFYEIAILQQDKTDIDEYNSIFGLLMIDFIKQRYDKIIVSIEKIRKEGGIKSNVILYYRFINLLAWSYAIEGENRKALKLFRMLEFMPNKIIEIEMYRWQVFLGEAYTLYRMGKKLDVVRNKLSFAVNDFFSFVHFNKNISFFVFGYIAIENEKRLFNLYSIVLLSIGDYETALSVLERYKYHNLFTTIESLYGEYFLERLFPPISGFFIIRNEIINIRNSYISAILYKQKSNMHELSLKYQNWKEAYKEIIRELLSSDYRFFVGDMYDVDIEEVKNVLADDEVLVYYFYDSKRLYVMAITHNDIKIYTQNIRNLEGKIKRFILYLEKGNKQYKHLSMLFYNKLLKWVMRKYSTKKVLYIVPNYALFYIPYYALLTGRREFVFNKVGLVLLPFLEEIYMDEKDIKYWRIAIIPTKEEVAEKYHKSEENEIEDIEGVFEGNVVLKDTIPDNVGLLHIATMGLQKNVFSPPIFFPSFNKDVFSVIYLFKEMHHIVFSGYTMQVENLSKDNRYMLGNDMLLIAFRLLINNIRNFAISLWFSNSEDTSKLWVGFYSKYHRYLLAKDKRARIKAFLEAIKIIYLRNPKPKYWGNFLIFGGIR
jgi:tetratricopeptide (TPR) repeat protein